jgi:hypothetical protein
MQTLLHVAAVAAGMIGAAYLGFNLPDPGADRRYDLVQIDDGESDIIDYDQTATDCALKIAAMRRAGYVVECQVSP